MTIHNLLQQLGRLKDYWMKTVIMFVKMCIHWQFQQINKSTKQSIKVKIGAM